MDTLSCLPDDVICHILSFLQTKKSVQTSVLSKRWRFLWAHVPLLEFFVYDTVDPGIVTKVVLQNNHDIPTFNLYCPYLKDCEKEFESWIESITARKIRNLAIHTGNQFELPRCLFDCKTLIDLSLTACGYIPASGVYFPVLKKLNLRRVRYESHESLAHLISGCPVLEELSVNEVKLDGHCCVSSPTLTRLTLKLYNDGNLNFEVKLDTPSLRYLRLDFFIPDKFSLGALESLIEANITLSRGEQHQENFIDLLLAIVGKLCNVQILSLSTDGTEVIPDSAFSALGFKFPNLSKLDLRTNMSFFTNFLESANNLRVLKLTGLMDTDDQYGWMEPKRVPACLISRLQTVNFCYFDCDMHEFYIVKYILMNAKVLKRMEIHPRIRQHQWKIKSVVFFEKVSQECQLVFD